MSDLTNYYACLLSSFKANGDEVMVNRTGLLEVCDRHDDAIELAIDLTGPARRVYVTVKLADLAAIVAERQPEPQP